MNSMSTRLRDALIAGRRVRVVRSAAHLDVCNAGGNQAAQMSNLRRCRAELRAVPGELHADHWVQRPSGWTRRLPPLFSPG
ncbi:hypothetical protein, partial [Xanthomonas perforans]|uniref:hypothetical protein n=1 Tax=Xanthomonas perforans TaxID=442694 RepID=UPI001F25326D